MNCSITCSVPLESIDKLIIHAQSEGISPNKLAARLIEDGLRLVEQFPRQRIISDFNGLLEIQAASSYEPYWVYESLSEMHPDLSLAEINYVGKLLGYTPVWAKYRYLELTSQKGDSND